MEIDEPLDFEKEDLVKKAHPVAKRRKKVIGLDDLVGDFLQENKKQKLKLKQAKTRVSYCSDEDDDSNVAKLSKCVEKCEKEMGNIGDEVDIHLWGLQVFGYQKTRPPIVCKPKFCEILRSFDNNELNSLVGLDIDKGENFLESLLVNGWLLNLVYARNHVDKAIATWTFSLMVYSSKEILSASACDFWTVILSPKGKIKIEWLPHYSDLIRALEVFGFLSEMQPKSLFVIDVEIEDSDRLGPPQNIRAWIKYVTVCLAARSKYSIFSVLEAEELVVIIISLFLDRQLLGLTVLVNECLLSSINFFTDDEWNLSYERLVKSLSGRIPKDTNCLRTIESIRGVDVRSKQLRHEVAFKMLIACLDNKTTDAEEILRLLAAVNVREKNCDLFKMYIYLVLTENWLFSNPTIEDKSYLYDRLGIYLRNCSF